MKNKNLLFGLIAFWILGCEEWNLNVESFPEIQTLEVMKEAIPTSIVLSAEISGLNKDDFLEQYGHVWSSVGSPIPSIEQNEGQSTFKNKGNGTFTTTLNELGVGQVYNYRAYYVFEGKVGYENIVGEFTTNSINLKLNIEEVSWTPGSLEPLVQGLISNIEPGLPIKSYGFAWSKEPSVDINNDLFVSNQGLISNESELNYENKIFLTEGISYVRPFVVIGNETIYGEEISLEPTDIWQARANMEGSLKAHSFSFSIGEKGYVSSVEAADFWEYNPDKDSWTQVGDFPGPPRKHGVAFTINGKGYVCTGGNFNCGNFASEFLNDLWEYEPVLDSWTQKANFPGIPRHGATGFSIENKAYVGTGINGTQALSDFWEYNSITDVWTQKTDFPGGLRMYASAFTIDGLGYMGTGTRQEGAVLDQVRDFWEYNPDEDQWTRLANFGNEGRAFSFAFSIGDKGFVGNGYDDLRNFKNDLWQYDPSINFWSQKADLPANGRISGTAFSLDGKGYMGGGCILYDFWVYVPDN